MTQTPGAGDVDRAWAELLSGSSPEVRDLAISARALIKSAIPDATEEVDAPDHLIAFTFAPGTIRGLIVAITLQKAHVNIMFSKGVELLALDSAGLLEGTGKVARHIKVRTADQLVHPELRGLLEAAAAATPR